MQAGAHKVAAVAGARFDSIRSRVMLLTALSMAGLLALSLFALLQQQHSNASLRTLYLDYVLSINRLKDVSDAYGADVVQAVYKVRDAELTPAEGQKRIAQAREIADKQWQAYLGSDISARERVLVNITLPLRTRVDAVAQEAFDRMPRASRSELRELANERLLPAMDALTQSLDGLTRLQLTLAGEEFDASQARWRRYLIVTVVGSLLLLAAAAWAAMALIKSVTQPLADAVQVAEAVAAGDLDVQVQTTSNDEIAQLLQAVDRMRVSLIEQAQQDPLTQLLNRRSFERLAKQEAQRAQRSGGRWALLMIDIDHFKRLNDSLGHAAGDHALVAVADCLRAALRTEDLAARWGGEEFVLLLVGTVENVAAQVAERIRQSLQALPLQFQAQSFRITASIGLAATQGAEQSLSSLLQRADEALYAAKAAGRNRVVRASGLNGLSSSSGENSSENSTANSTANAAEPRG